MNLCSTDVFQIYLVLTLACNLSCPHCIRSFSKNNSKDSIDFNALSRIFKDINKIIPNVQLILTGGEPTIHKDFFPIIELALAEFKKVYICSNGVINKDILDKLCLNKNVTIQISLDGTKDIHDLIRGKGSFDHAIKTIKLLLEKEIPVMISSTVNKNNIESMFDLSNFLNKYNISLWQIKMEQTFSLAENNKRLPIEDWNTFVDKIVHTSRKKLSIKKLYDFQLFNKMEQKIGPEVLKKNIKNCGFCSSKLYIYPDLSVRACTCMEKVILGNFKQDSLEDILKVMKNTRKIIQIKEDSICFSCKWNYLCNGGCPGYSLFFNESFGYGDIRCPLVREWYENK